ncbi:hypothetical protein H9Q69_006718 [Fusarium xylarioides]|nr:hypothetical protein H9Q69_006718 [Fusarium xylarioides]
MVSNGVSHAVTNGHTAAAKPDGLNIIIIWAGIGGLTAAILLRRQGHRVTLLEQSRFANEVGAAMHLAPNANGILRRLGIFAETIGANVFERITEFNAANEVVRDADITEAHKIWQHPWHLVHRDGSQVQGDLVVGADGVHSRSRQKVVEKEWQAYSSGKSAFRFLVPRQHALDDPETARFAQHNGQLIIWYAADRRIVMYPCDDNKMFNFVCIHPREESDPGSKEDWNNETSMSVLLGVYKDFDPALLKLLSKASPESLKAWELLDMDILPTWTDKRLTLLGDAAHPFLPHQGQGAGVAIEDAASLAVVLPLGTSPEEVPGRLRLYQDFRYDRANRIQEFSRQAGKDKPDKDFDMMAYTNFNLGHDEWDNSTSRFRKWDWARKPHLYWRMPVSFGPFPGPRQTFTGEARNATNSTFTTASIKFKTSRTLLQNLFPSTSFRFKSPGTVAYASFSQTTLNKMEWLGGSGYRHIGLYIHGVQYVQKDGTVRDGTFLPILWESLTDPIVSGREELGMPKLYCSIDVWRRTNSYRIQTGWQGVNFGSFTLEGLREIDSGSSKGTIGGEDDEGIFAYKYIPKVGDRGKTDVEHATFVPHAEESKVVPSKVVKVFTADKASFEFDPHDWEALPTLHHVVSRLVEVPVYEILGGKVVEGVGVPDVSSARRID